MEKTIVECPEIKLIGLSVRTSHQEEQDPATAKILPCLRRYFSENISEKIVDALDTDMTIFAYTDYESDHMGAYTYFIGEEVDSFQHVPEGLTTHTIPAQTYIQFTPDPGPMMRVAAQAWEAIGQLSEAELGGKRTYKTDFEVYDDETVDHTKAVVHLYVGIAL